MCLKILDHPSFKEVKNSLLQELRGQFATDYCAKINLRLIILPGTMQNHHLHVKLVGSVSNNTPITNVINSLSINDNEDRENADACVINSFLGYNDDNLNASSNYHNNNGNDASKSKNFIDNESNDIDYYEINACRNFNNNRNNSQKNRRVTVM